jgi:hypothetical protein
MITAALDQDISHSCVPRHYTPSYSIVAPVATVTTDTEAIIPLPGAAPNFKADEVFQPTGEIKANYAQHEFHEPPEWTPKLEAKFYRLAENNALNRLSLEHKVEFEKLLAIRRLIKNPRSGEEVLAEYQQRMTTRNLVQALTQYVEFHQQYSSNRSR